MRFQKNTMNCSLIFPSQLTTILKKLTTDEEFIESIRGNLTESTPAEFISYCVLFDLVQVLKMISNGSIKKDSIEMFGVVAMGSNLTSGSSYDLLEFDYETVSQFSALLKTESYRNSCANMLELAGKKNPFNFDIQEAEGESRVSKPMKSIFSLPGVLKILEHKLFDEYVVLLNRFATVISKADNIITKDEEASLREIFQITHNPIPGKENKSLNISEVDSGETLNDVLAELQSLIGLNEVKNEG